jgi:hypothetical protein
MITAHLPTPKQRLVSEDEIHQHHGSGTPCEASGKADCLTNFDAFRSLAFDGEPQSQKGQGEGDHGSNSEMKANRGKAQASGKRHDRSHGRGMPATVPQSRNEKRDGDKGDGEESGGEHRVTPVGW